MNTKEQLLLPEAMQIQMLSEDAVALLKSLIMIPSFSKQEDNTADLLFSYFEKKGIGMQRKLNNVWCFNKYYDPTKPTVLLNSHHDTVQPNTGYTIDPYTPLVVDGKLYGLGSNDAGGALVSMISVFLFFYEKTGLKYNFIIALTAEEEISGKNGIELILPELGEIAFAIVGEPTKMNLAIAEKGLLVVDCIVHGRSGHAARDEGENAILKAMKQIEWFQTFQFPEISEMLGPVKMSVTMINSGTQHNVTPDRCEFTVDVRTTDAYTNSEVLEIIKQQVSCDVNARSLRLNSSSIDKEHEIVRSGLALGRELYGSPTSSDQAVMNFPSLKLGPGDSARSHTADEFIYLSEIEEGIELYIKILNEIS